MSMYIVEDTLSEPKEYLALNGKNFFLTTEFEKAKKFSDESVALSVCRKLQGPGEIDRVHFLIVNKIQGGEN